MWYETLWSVGIIQVCVFGIGYVSGPFNKMDTGRWHRRNFNTPKRMWMFKRDHRLTGNVYVVNGLETIKDD